MLVREYVHATGIAAETVRTLIFMNKFKADVFAKIVEANMNAVRQVFGGKKFLGAGVILGGGLTIRSALKRAVNNDVKHQTDGHKKVIKNKL